MHFSFFQSYFHFFRFDPKIRSDMTRRKNQEKKLCLQHFHEFLWMIRTAEVNMKNGWVDKSMAQKHILKECVIMLWKFYMCFWTSCRVLWAQNSTLLLFLNVKNCCCCSNWSHEEMENNISVALTNIFSLSPLVNHATTALKN